MKLPTKLQHECRHSRRGVRCLFFWVCLLPLFKTFVDCTLIWNENRISLTPHRVTAVTPWASRISSVFSERELAFTIAICYQASVCCLSVTLVHPLKFAFKVTHPLKNSAIVPVKFNFSRKKSATKFLCMKTSSGKVAVSYTHLTLPTILRV